MTAGEIEVERLVPFVDALRVGGERDLRVRGHEADDQLFPQPAGGVGPDLVGEPARGDGDQPALWMVGQAVRRPLRRRRDQRLLHGVLAGREVAIPADQRAQDRRREVAQQVLGRGIERWRHASGVQSGGGPLITWRTSIAMFNGVPPRPGAAEASAAMA